MPSPGCRGRRPRRRDRCARSAAPARQRFGGLPPSSSAVSERPSRRGSAGACAHASNVGARSTVPVSADVARPARTPGPTTISGTRTSWSNAVRLPAKRRCSPRWKPLSEPNTRNVLRATRAFRSAARMRPIISSIACTDRTRMRYCWSSIRRRAALSGRRRPSQVGGSVVRALKAARCGSDRWQEHPPVSRRGDRGRVRRVGGDRDEEGVPAGRPADEPRGTTSDDVGQVVARAIPGDHGSTVVGGLVAEAAVAAARAEPLVPAGVRAVPVRLVAVEVLAHQRGAIAQPAGARSPRCASARRTCEMPSSRLGPRVAQHAGVVRERARQDRRPRAAAERVGDHELAEGHPFALERRTRGMCRTRSHDRSSAST